MPRVSNVYSAPSGTLATTLTPASSSAYNAFVNDLVADANAVRPVVAGGTGGGTVAAAQASLGVTEVIGRLSIADNPIINGAMQVNQRGNLGTITTPGAYLLDRWKNVATGGTVSMRALSPPLGTVLATYEPRLVLQQTVSGQSGSNYAAIRQPIEELRTFSGQTATVLFFARRISGAGNMQVRLTQNFAGGSPVPIVLTSSSLAITTSWAPYAATFSLPTVSTVANDGTLDLDLIISDGAGTLGVQAIGVQVWGVHMLPGTWPETQANFYRPQLFADELARCQRYYYYNDRVKWKFQATAAGQAFQVTMMMPVTMRNNPTMVDPGLVGTTNVASLLVSAPSDCSMSLVVTSTASGTVTVDDTKMSADAEL